MARRYVLSILNQSKELKISYECELSNQDFSVPGISRSLHWFRKGAPPGIKGSDWTASPKQ